MVFLYVAPKLIVLPADFTSIRNDRAGQVRLGAALGRQYSLEPYCAQALQK